MALPHTESASLRAVPATGGDRAPHHAGQTTAVQRYRRAPTSNVARRALRVEGRRTWFETIEEMQLVLDAYMETYNQRRPHQGRGMNGRTPATAFIEGLPKPQQQKEERSANNRATNKPPDARPLTRHCQGIALSVHINIGQTDLNIVLRPRLPGATPTGSRRCVSLSARGPCAVAILRIG
jgi:hypothetical protein